MLWNGKLHIDRRESEVNMINGSALCAIVRPDKRRWAVLS